MQNIKKFKVLIFFTTFFVIGLIVRYLLGEQSSIWRFWSAVDISFAVVLGILAFIAYKDLVREKDLIRIVLNVENEKKIDTGLCLLRKNCTRSEVIGLIEMLKSSNEPLKYDVKNLHKLLDEINSVQSTDAQKLYVPIRKDELSQYDIK